MSEQEGDVEIDLARYARRLLARWWIVAATVVVVVGVALVTQTGSSSHTYTARTLVFLGQPLGPNGQALTTSLGSNPATPGTLIHNDDIVAAAAQASGLTPGQVRGAVSSSPVSQAITKTNYTPIVNIVVQGPWKDKVAPASLAVAQQIVKQTNRYQNGQEAALGPLVAAQRAQLDSANTRLKLAQSNLNRITHAKGLTQLQQFTLIQSAISTVNGLSQQVATIESTYATNVQQLAALDDQNGIEKSVIVTRPHAVSTSATSGGANIGIAILLGLIIGVVLTLVSYLIWPVKPRTAPEPEPVREPARL